MNFKRPLILASNSPRRQYLMKEMGYQFSIQKPDADESFPIKMYAHDVPDFIAQKKAESIQVRGSEVVMTSDTVVILNNHILNKPADRQEAIEMLTQLSGKTHIVITAVCLKDYSKVECFNDRTTVTFKELRQEEIENYVDQFQPYDKAGAYGAQDCLPKGVNPCSPEELEFLKKINKLDLAEKTFTNQAVGTGLHAIEKIKGPYFNVMGLPICSVFEHLEHF